MNRHPLAPAACACADDVVRGAYDRLLGIAMRCLRAAPPSSSVDPASLVHEAFLRLKRREPPDGWTGEEHLLAVATVTMRRVLIDRARRSAALKRGGCARRCDLETVVAEDEPRDVVAPIRAALEDLRDTHARAARVVALRFLDGYTEEEAAVALGVTPRTARRDWTFARAWLRRRLAADSVD